jgi:hypothetical protein
VVWLIATAELLDADAFLLVSGLDKRSCSGVFFCGFFDLIRMMSWILRLAEQDEKTTENSNIPGGHTALGLLT